MSKYERLWRYVGGCSNETLTLTFEEVGEIAGVSIDHSFLQHKKELGEYGWEVRKISIKEQKVTFEKKEG